MTTDALPARRRPKFDRRLVLGRDVDAGGHG